MFFVVKDGDFNERTEGKSEILSFNLFLKFGIRSSFLIEFPPLGTNSRFPVDP